MKSYLTHHKSHMKLAEVIAHIYMSIQASENYLSLQIGISYLIFCNMHTFSILCKPKAYKESQIRAVNKEANA